ncbi:NAD(P)-dependent oxidoreductase [Sphingobium sp. SCG-1]|uniref:NAD(P)-dependent oxidoreductase n=1 Tax=Sphingobium sp. SCG-1 TaxID=2072936 RepID=UPI000CD6ADEB|nr:NAD(P)-dependent oxidoreductase [Sphingobium sp. SCG-1]AUW57175.1 NAD(P)-dependent oxidoreductase [Sphingobium sp. SCG-1]
MNHMQSGMSVGFIGLGDQGLPMAKALAEGGFDLHVWARRPLSYKDLGKVRYTAHDGLGALAQACSVVALCLRTDDDLFEVVQNGLLTGLKKGSVIVNHGTGTPANAGHLAELCAQHRIESLDAPVSGARRGAEEKTLTTLVGGPEAVANRCEPLFQSFSRHVVYLGDSGSGQAAKLFNNTMMIMNQANVADLVDLASRYGLNLWKLIEAIKLCSGFSNSLIHINTVLTPETAPHMAAVEAEDMDIFAKVMANAGIDAEAVVARGHHGAKMLPDLIRKLNC